MKITDSFYKDLYDNSPYLIAVGDHRTGKFHHCNNTLLIKLGYTLQQILDMDSYEEIYHEEGIPELLAVIKLYEEQGYVDNYEVILKKSNGTRFYAILNLSGIRDENGAISYTRVVWQDNNALVYARQELMQTHEDLIKQRNHRADSKSL